MAIITLVLSIIAVVLAAVILIILLARKPVSNSEAVEKCIQSGVSQISTGVEKNERVLREEMSKNREEAGVQAKLSREESANALKGFTDSTMKQMTELTRSVEQKMNELRAGNDQKLEQMRLTVDEKLHKTLETRLGESFKLVSDKIESVSRGLGEMQALASSVGDLKRVISNPKTKGVLGEYQLQALIKDVLTEGQYVENLALKKYNGEDGRVEFAVKLPGTNAGVPVYLPIDAKYPTTEYDKLLEAYNSGDPKAIEKTQADLERKILSMAADIALYITPPITSDFAVMFLPFEGLFAEVIRRPGIFERLKREHKVIVTGPTTFAALVNALQVGFATLAVQQNASEMKELLVSVKAEFEKFGIILDNTHEKLMAAADSIDDASKKTKTINNKLKKVEQIEM